MDIDSHKMFEMIKNGEIALEDFLLWVEKIEDRSYSHGESNGYWDGYYSGQDNSD